MPTPQEKRPRVRAACAVVENGRLLLVEHTKGDRKYWLLPGGGLDWGESLKSACQREVLEETGLQVEAQDLMLLSETLSPDGKRHVVHLVFQAKLVGGEIAVPKDEPRVTGVSWVNLSELRELVLHPPMQDDLIRALESPNDGPRFLGNLWVD